MKYAKAAPKPPGGPTIVRYLLIVASLCALTACAAGHSLVPGATAGWGDLSVSPDHGASALPGATLPCGFPAHGRARHPASCPVAVNVHIPALRNPHFPAAQLPGLHPEQLVQAYGFPANAVGMTVAIVDAFDNRQAEKDLNKYRVKFGLGECTTASGCFRKVNQRGGTKKYPHQNKAWAQEIS
ncbi:MAG TPA: hypothetical protein VKB39_10925, partial [Candidatus Baltobacteraceae bacterium]|nr:hypothetical protein [Candidatus Baltobacteraceae bacterium]